MVHALEMKLFEIVLNKPKEDLCQMNVRYVRVATERGRYRVGSVGSREKEGAGESWERSRWLICPAVGLRLGLV